jgi:hypothetical protein
MDGEPIWNPLWIDRPRQDSKLQPDRYEREGKVALLIWRGFRWGLIVFGQALRH